MKEEKRELHLTGKSVEDFEGTAPELNCYLCKRQQKSESLYYEDNDVFTTPEFELSWYIVETELIRFHYLLCPECFILIDNFRDVVGDLILDKTNVPMKSNLN
jgi:hypothetical protein